MGLRIGADVGGTFTDVVLQTSDGAFVSTKVLTTHDRPEVGILAAIETVVSENGVSWGEVEQVIHGTTLATNAVIERKGSKTAFVTTKGFRDVIETRTESRFEQYDLNIVLPTPLVERADRYVVPERIGANGETLRAFDSDAARRVVDTIRAKGYESVAVGFMHSYRNPSHEQQMRELLADKLPGVAVSLSSEVSPQMREFERFNTVCVNAYVQPLVASYVRRLETELVARGAKCPLYLIHSGGGLVSVDTAVAFPVRLVESGPAGGAIFAAHLAARYGREQVLSYDMGGTTAKIALIERYTPHTTSTFEVARTTRFKKGSGMPISIPVIEMIEIGAGGGSIAEVDSLGQIQVGPRSAGSEPGPACYARGGHEPTVTDANLQLGRLDPATFGAKDIKLSPIKAQTAIETVANQIDLSVDDTAVGIGEIIDENMANAARVHAVENGKDLTGYSMVAFGGGAPLHASRLMDKLGLSEVFVPPDAGVGSAVGFLLAPFSYEAVRSLYTTVEDLHIEAVNTLLDELMAEAEGFVRRGTDAKLVTERRASMRYRGQGWEIPVELPDGVFDESSSATLAGLFTDAYRQFFGRAIDQLTVEVVSWSVKVMSVVEPPEVIELVEPVKPVEIQTSRPMFDPAISQRVSARIVDRNGLQTGHTVNGPAVIIEDQTSTVVASHQAAVVQADHSLRITRKLS